jgi:hypothetical protein
VATLIQKKAIILLVALTLVIGVIAGYSLLPKRYLVGQSLTQTTVFWNGKEAFFFLNTNTIGRSSNFLSDKLGKTNYGYLALLLGARSQFYEYGVTAYRLEPSGELQRLPLPDDSTTLGRWSLEAGQLQLTPVASGNSHFIGFKWDGAKFVAVQPQKEPHTEAGGNTTLSPDDLDDEDDGEMGFVSPSARKAFKEAGWHYKQLGAFGTKESQATLPIALNKSSFDLTITKFPPPTEGFAHFDMLQFGTKALQLTKNGEPQKSQLLWSQNGWQTISKSDFVRHAQRTGQGARLPVSLFIWLAIFAFATLWRFGTWGHVLLGLMGMKRRVLKNMATSYSFPPATPAQFPQLDMSALERYTQEFEGVGFVQLLDFSLVSNAAHPIPSFCRLFVHTRNHCFGEVSQLFPPGKAPLALACSIQSVLQDGWSIAFSNRKPNAAGSLIRRRKALGVSMPGTDASALLQAFLQMREQVCQDLGISPMRNDTLEAYIAKVQRAATEMREAERQRNFATAISHVYYRKLSLLKTREEYTWLGDYPKEAERRKQGFPAEARAL